MLKTPSRVRHNFFALNKLFLSAVASASLVEMALPPELPAPTKIVSPQIDLDLENAHLRPSPLEYSQDQINAYLTYRLISKKKALTYPFLTFVRATASFREGACTIGVERSLFGYSIFSRTSHRVDTSAGKLLPQMLAAGSGGCRF